MLQIAVTGKPNVGKSSFFNSATSSSVEMANYPFTTIDANKAVAHVVSDCPCKELNVTCNPRNSICIDGKRLIPVELIDVAGLVPGAHEGKGLGNKFLDDLMQAKVLIHVIDASGSTNAEGQPVEAGSHNPLDDLEFMEHEIVMWMYGILNRNWSRLVRKIEAEKLDIAKVIFDQLSGTGISLEDIIDTPISPELLPPTKDGKIAQKTEEKVGPYLLHDFFLYYVLRFGFRPKKIYSLAVTAFDGEFNKDTIKKWLAKIWPCPQPTGGRSKTIFPCA